MEPSESRIGWPGSITGLLSALGLGLLVCCITLLNPQQRGWLRGKRYVMPPGPKGYPLIGSLPDWLQARQGARIIEWLVAQSRYGEMTTLSMGTKVWVILNSNRVLNEIIAKRASIVHDRPYFPIVGEIVSRNERVFLHQTAEWRQSRRFLHKLVFGLTSKNQGDIIEDASLRLLQSYLDEPEMWYAHNYRFPVEVIYQLLTGTQLQKSRDELEELQGVTSTFLTSINASIVEFFPQFASLPKMLQFWRPSWEEVGKHHYNVYKHWWAGMKEELKTADSNQASFLRDTILKDYVGTDEQRMYLSLLPIEAGADNPRMAVNTWVMACLAYPDVMTKARQQIDLVCGAEAQRLPKLDDLPNLPYVFAIVKEVLRWRPTVPLFPQRVLVEDMEFEGYYFPAGTEFLVNGVSVSQCDYEAPDKFWPERWLEGSKEDHGGLEQDLWQFAFSGGKRSCLGYKLTQRELFLVFAQLLYCFDFAPRGDFDDKELNAFSPGEPFPVKVTSRGRPFEDLVRNAVAK